VKALMVLKGASIITKLLLFRVVGKMRSKDDDISKRRNVQLVVA
jgi:hypothetical protein